MLAQTDQAITDCMSMQSYSRPGMSIVKSNLDILLKRQKELVAQINRYEQGAVFVSDCSIGATSGGECES